MGESKRRKGTDPDYGKFRRPYRVATLEKPPHYQAPPLPCFGCTAFELVGDRTFSVTFFSAASSFSVLQDGRRSITFLPMALSVEPTLSKLAEKPHLITIESFDTTCSLDDLLSVKLDLFAAKPLAYRDRSGLLVMPCVLESERLLLSAKSVRGQVSSLMKS
jgi:hypothetical protein